VPKSRIRKKAAYTPPVAVSNRKKYGSPWVGPAMATMFLIGVAWLVVYYLASSHNVPLPISSWNLLVGFGFLIVGFMLSTRWR
jgi:hypothetical protein